jgi:hypothetical protein
MTILPQGPPALLACKPGDVLVVRTGGAAGRWIRFGAAIRDESNLDNHVAVIDHVDTGGTVWAIEGRPGGVGWVDAANYFSGENGKYALTNRKQPKSTVQRNDICAVVRQLLKAGYDWDAIAQDAIIDLGLPDLWAEKWHGTTPAHVVCSSLAVWAYHKVTLDAPTQEDMRHIQPADWSDWIIQNGWN